MIYLDHNSTTQPAPGVVEAVERAVTELWGNPSSVHRFGQQAKHAIETARVQVAGLLGVGGGGRGVVFTGSGTEAISHAIRGSVGALRSFGVPTLITSTVEHSAVQELAEAMRADGQIELCVVGVDGDGRLDLDQLGDELGRVGVGADTGAGLGGAGIVSIQWVNNETGVVQDVDAIGRMCREHKAIFHCDATQWVGKMKTSVEDESEPLGRYIDILTCSPHKFHGIKGVGVLWSRRGTRLVPLFPGSQELGRRGGTEPVPAIVGAGVAAQQAWAWLEEESDGLIRAGSLRDHLESSIISRCSGLLADGLVVHGLSGERVWNTTNIGFPRLEAEALLLAMSERGLCVSAGAACASGSLDPSSVLRAMGVGDVVGRGSVRFSLSRETTLEEIERAVEVVFEAVSVVGRSLVL